MADSLTNFLGKFQHQNVKVLLFAVRTFRHNHIMGKLEDVTFVIKNISLSEGSLHENLMFMTPPIAQMADIGFKVVLLERLNQKWKQKHF